MQAPMKQVLTIAGSDSGGAAGIQADLKTFTSLHARQNLVLRFADKLQTYGASVITALTAQNTV
jgi:hydroxymethylpyrimidine/phosphomethylpyrimidine kinase